MVALVLAAGRSLAGCLRGRGDVCDSDALSGLVDVGGERQLWWWVSLMGVGAGRRRGNGAAALLLAALRLLAVRFRGEVNVCVSDTLGGRSAVGVGGGRQC